MKILVSGLLLFGIAVFATFTVVITAPYYLYHQAINNQYHGTWYTLDFFNGKMLYPDGKIEIKKYEQSLDNRWKVLQFGNAIFPVPVSNPQYTFRPIMKYDKGKHITHKGLEIITPKGLVLGRILFLPNGLLAKDHRKQKLFKLPIVQKILAEYDPDKVWQDIFQFQIKGWNIPYEDMIYNLYLLYKRSITLPERFLRFGNIERNKMLIETQSPDKDFKVEIVQLCRNRTIYSLLTQWRLDSEEAAVIRSRVIDEVNFEPSSPNLTSFIYKEFQSLPHQSKIDHEGLAYLFSAWTHSTENPNLIRAMVGYLERGDGNERQLEPIYEYASTRFGTTYSTKKIEVELTSEAMLRRNMELEAQREQEERERIERLKADAPVNLPPEEQMYLELEEAKKQRNKSQDGQAIMN